MSIADLGLGQVHGQEVVKGQNQDQRPLQGDVTDPNPDLEVHHLPTRGVQGPPHPQGGHGVGPLQSHHHINGVQSQGHGQGRAPDHQKKRSGRHQEVQHQTMAYNPFIR